MHEVDQVDKNHMFAYSEQRWECVLYNTPTLLVTNKVFASSFHTAHGIFGSTQIKTCHIYNGISWQAVRSVETKYLDVGPSIPLLETTFGDAQYRLG